MDYQVTLTPQAMEQLRQTALYIAHTLQESETAKRWADLLYKEIAGLCFILLYAVEISFGRGRTVAQQENS